MQTHKHILVIDCCNSFFFFVFRASVDCECVAIYFCFVPPLFAIQFFFFFFFSFFLRVFFFFFFTLFRSRKVLSQKHPRAPAEKVCLCVFKQKQLLILFSFPFTYPCWSVFLIPCVPANQICFVERYVEYCWILRFFFWNWCLSFFFCSSKIKRVLRFPASSFFFLSLSCLLPSAFCLFGA